MKDVRYENYILELMENDIEKKILTLIIKGEDYDKILEKILMEE